MSLLSRLFGPREDDRAAVRPLWQRVVEVSRDPAWYAECGVADTVPGRFDMVTLVLAVILLRMEREPELAVASSRLTELFVDDMDGQLRQSGVGDLVVGKHIGRLMGALGGRLGALRDAVGGHDEAKLTEAVGRNLSLSEGASPVPASQRLHALALRLDQTTAPELLAGQFA